jgi:CRP/FNR family transcriptional regulator, cyclic AMP receptor protein
VDSWLIGQGTPLLTEEELLALEGAGQAITRPKGHIFIAEGDEETDFALLIKKGHVKVVSGKPPRIIAIRRSGEIVGEMAALGMRRRNASVIALDEVQALRLPSVKLVKFLDQYPRVYRTLLLVTHERLDEMKNRYLDTDLAVEQRLAKALIYLVDNGLGETGPDGVILRFAQEDLANLVGANTLESVKKTIRAFKASGVVDTGRLMLHILDPGALREIAEGDRTTL